ncbi:S8 family serine peptidase, partial [Chloroflexota bacterium]
AIDIAILDTGIDQDHVDLAAKIVANMNFTSSGTVDDNYGHGTHVAGIAAAGNGVAGIGFDSSLMNGKVLGDNGSGYYSWVASGVIWATDNGAEVINMSLGGTAYSSTLQSAIDYAWDNGVVVVAAAGNNGSSTQFYPAACTNCIAVAATSSSDSMASWSNYGDWVDVAAPGVSIYSTTINNNYGYKSGTSMASPHVAGLAALVFTTEADASGNGYRNDEVRSAIESSCDDIGLSGIGHGRINAYRAVSGTTITTGAITGCVTDAGTELPIEGAEVSDGIRTTTSGIDGNYSIADVPAGDYTVTAFKDGYNTSFCGVSVISDETTTADFALIEETIYPAYSIEKTVDETSVSAPGELQYTVVLSNDGNVDLTGITMTDSLTDPGTPVESGSDIGVLNVGETWTWTYTYPVTQDDINAGGSIDNTATADCIELEPVSDSVSVTLNQNPAYSIEKTVDETLISAPGELEYIVVLSNDGNIDLTGITLTDSLTDPGNPTESSSTNGVLNVGETWTWAYTCTVTQADIEAGGSINNTATADCAQLGPVSDSTSTTIQTVKSMWISGISYSVKGKNLFIEVTAAGEKGAVGGASIVLQLECDGKAWDFHGTTDASGAVTFKLGKAPTGAYVVTVISLTCTGYTWDQDKGLVFDNYVLSQGK